MAAHGLSWGELSGGHLEVCGRVPIPVPSVFPPAEDTVYLRDEDERREYVLSQQGLIYQGARDYITSTPWNFGQVCGAQPPRTPGATALSFTGRGSHTCPPDGTHPAPQTQPARGEEEVPLCAHRANT